MRTRDAAVITGILVLWAWLDRPAAVVVAPAEEEEQDTELGPIAVPVGQGTWIMCPERHTAHYRESDRAIYCDTCVEIYYPGGWTWSRVRG